VGETCQGTLANRKLYTIIQETRLQETGYRSSAFFIFYVRAKMNVVPYRKSSVNPTFVMKALSCAQPSDPGKKVKKKQKKDGRRKSHRNWVKMIEDY
jgi:hypothetical protein